TWHGRSTRRTYAVCILNRPVPATPQQSHISKPCSALMTRTPVSCRRRPRECRTFASIMSPKARGTRVGSYKLLEKIGEGGFGVVFMAEQVQPVQRKVALKIIKPGMDTAQVVARFESERQALALMVHPNIAQIYDGGATESGRPYFVMELVRGVP